MSLLLLLANDQITGATVDEPEVRAQIDFVPGVATDVSSDLRSFSFFRGKQRELDRYQAGRGNVVLSNADRKYDPAAVLLLSDTFDFEGGTVGQWQIESGDGGTLTSSTDRSYSGLRSMKYSYSGGSGKTIFIPTFDQVSFEISPQALPAWVPGGPISMTTRIYLPSIAPRTMVLDPKLEFYDEDGNFLSSIFGTTMDFPSVFAFDAWHLVTVSGTVPATARYTQPLFEFSTSGGATNIYWDAFTFDGLFLDVKPNRRIRIPVNYAGTTHPLIEGFIDKWVQRSNGPNDAVVSVEFTDGFKVLSKANLASSAYAQEVQADSPVAWWRLGEPSSATVTYDAINGATGLLEGTGGAFGAQSLISREGDTAFSGSGGSAAIKVEDTRAFLSGSAITIEAVFQGTVGSIFYHQRPNDNNRYLNFSVNSITGVVEFVVFDSVGNFLLLLQGTVAVDDGIAHHLALTWDGTSLKSYVDGVWDSGAAVSTTASLSVNAAHAVVGNSENLGGIAFTGTLDEVALYNTALSAERIAAHAGAVSTPWDGDLPGERIDRVLDAINWPTLKRDLDTGSTVLQSADLAMSALEHCQKVAESEFGKLFIDKHGNVEFISRTGQWNLTAVATFTDDADYQASDPEYTDELIRNDVTISRSEGVAQNVKDQDSIDEYEINSYTLDGLFHDSDDVSRSAAQYIVNVYKDPLLRISKLTFNPRTNPAVLFPILLGIELGDWVTVQETPQNVGSAITQTAVVEGIGFTWSPKNWQITLNLSPADTSPYWQIGVPGFSEIGVTTRVSF